MPNSTKSNEAITEIKQGVVCKADGSLFKKNEIDLIDLREESKALGEIRDTTIKEKAIVNGEIAKAEKELQNKREV